ncbi:hypothetical protein AB4354_09650 [Vibrio splendidus]|uniref:hypothetical protein n=1 Tax=Vibrio TaxID=662 RepID=UPI000C8464E3|nr:MULTISPECIES: hypothetical protein [Vibrio]MCG9694635.1 hypothetical protein [Vibrio sp. Isolate22]PMH07981.1 hypothetical protein BCU75_14470 [Vibrio splendidus]
MNEIVNIEIDIPKAIGISKVIEAPQGCTLINVIKSNYKLEVHSRIIDVNDEINRFCLVYLDGIRANDSNMTIVKDCKIEVILPMAGG